MLTQSLIIISLVVIHIIFTDHVESTGKQFYNQKKVEIYDIGHQHLSCLNQKWITSLLNLIVFLPLFLPSKGLFDFISYFMTIILVRHVFLSLTILPPTEDCEPEIYSGYRKYLEGHCYDKIFSGHFAFLYLFSLISYQYGLITNEYLLIILNIVYGILVIGTKSHYTIDVVISFLITSLIYQYKLGIFFT